MLLCVMTWCAALPGTVVGAGSTSSVTLVLSAMLPSYSQWMLDC